MKWQELSDEALARHLRDELDVVRKTWAELKRREFSVELYHKDTFDRSGFGGCVPSAIFNISDYTDLRITKTWRTQL